MSVLLRNAVCSQMPFYCVSKRKRLTVCLQVDKEDSKNQENCSFTCLFLRVALDSRSSSRVRLVVHLCVSSSVNAPRLTRSLSRLCVSSLVHVCITVYSHTWWWRVVCASVILFLCILCVCVCVFVDLCVFEAPAVSDSKGIHCKPTQKCLYMSVVTQQSSATTSALLTETPKNTHTRVHTYTHFMHVYTHAHMQRKSLQQSWVWYHPPTHTSF